MRPRTYAEEEVGKGRVTLRQSCRHATGGQQFEIIAESENTYTFQARIDPLLGPEDGDDQVWGEIGKTICGALLSGQKAAVIANGQTRAGKTTTIQMLVRRTAREVAAFAERSLSALSAEEARGQEDGGHVMSASMVEEKGRDESGPGQRLYFIIFARLFDDSPRGGAVDSKWRVF